MERQQYLEMCREVSKLKDGILHIKTNVPDGLRVIYKGTEYYPEYFVRRYFNGQAVDNVVLHSLKTNSTVEVKLSKVEAVK